MAYGVFFCVRHLYQSYPERTEQAMFVASAALGAILSLVLIGKLAEIAGDDGIDANTVYLIQEISGHKNLMAAFIMLILPIQLAALWRAKAAS